MTKFDIEFNFKPRICSKSNFKTYLILPLPIKLLLCIIDLDQGSKVIIFESFFNIFKASVVFEAAGEIAKIGLKSSCITKFNFIKSMKHTVY
jgi:hypothetical protein